MSRRAVSRLAVTLSAMALLAMTPLEVPRVGDFHGVSIGAVANAAEADDELDTIVATLELLVEADADATRQCLRLLADKTQARELDGKRRTRLAKSIGPLVDNLLKRPENDPLRADAAILSASLRLSSGASPTRAIAMDSRADFEIRRRALAALIAAEDRAALEIAESWLSSGLDTPNAGAAPHNFSIDALKISQDQAPGETYEIAVNAPAGQYEYYCNVPGHKEAGMVGTLTAK